MLVFLFFHNKFIIYYFQEHPDYKYKPRPKKKNLKKMPSAPMGGMGGMGGVGGGGQGGFPGSYGGAPYNAQVGTAFPMMADPYAAYSQYAAMGG